MGDISVSLRVKYASGQAAANLAAKIEEGSGRTYDVGKTRSDGTISAVLRPRRKIRIANLEADDPTDNPVLQIIVSDPAGHRVEAPVVPVFVLPPEFDPSASAAQALRPLVDANAPGYVFLIRKDGETWANATRGLARVAAAGVVAQNMTNDTIVHLASMSKPITATAVAAMIDDWTSMRDAIAALGSPGAPTQIMHLGPLEIAVPTVLVPLFSDRGRAATFLSGTWLTHVHPKVRTALDAFANHGATISPQPVSPPGYFGLLRRVLDHVAVPGYADPFLPLIRGRLGAGATIGAGVDTITIADLLTHHTDLTSRALNPALHSAAEIAAVAPSEPNGGLARNDYWGFVKLLLAEPCNRMANINYGNNNYTVLTTVIEACTDTTFDDYVTRRLFFDPRFSRIRRRVVDPALGALYYSGAAPNWAGGVTALRLQQLAGKWRALRDGKPAHRLVAHALQADARRRRQRQRAADFRHRAFESLRPDDGLLLTRHRQSGWPSRRRQALSAQWGYRRERRFGQRQPGDRRHAVGVGVLRAVRRQRQCRRRSAVRSRREEASLGIRPHSHTQSGRSCRHDSRRTASRPTTRAS
jgi:CubicO group peptidase (beta-lactamase class C family)